jgi:hypothetical protein
MVQASPFCGKALEDANAHLRTSWKCAAQSTPKPLQWKTFDLFPFSLLGKAKTWFYANKNAFTTWDAWSNDSWPSTFQWARATPFRTGFPVFNNSTMKPSQKPGNVSRNHHSMPIPWHGRVARAKVLIIKIASNQSWKEDRQPARAKGVHQIDGIDMLAAKMDLLMKS